MANLEPVVAPASAATSTTSLLDEILAETKLKKEDEAYEPTNLGIRTLLAEILKADKPVERVDKTMIDARIAEIDVALSKLLDAVVHHADFQARESTWRGLKFLVDRTDFRENIRIRLLNVSKEDLLADFEDAPEAARSGLYRIVYSDEYGTAGGKPYAAVFANYELGPGPQDTFLLEKASAVAAMAHAPFITAASPEFFGLKDSLGLPRLKDLEAHFEGPQYTRWRALRENPDTIYTGLVERRFLLRHPYSAATVPAKSFHYEEAATGHDQFLWGNDVFMLATRLTESFAKFRWCAHIIGPQAGGAVEGLPLHVYEDMGASKVKIPTEIAISERLEYELSEQGFIAPTYEKNSDTAVFFSANSIHKPKRFANTDEGKEAEANYRLGTQLPYLFIATRIAHYLKVIGRDLIGTSAGRAEIERQQNEWIGQYVSDSEAPTAAIRGARPLKKAQVIVTDVPGEPGWYRYEVKMVPHFKNMGGSMALSLVGKLDRQ